MKAGPTFISELEAAGIGDIPVAVLNGYLVIGGADTRPLTQDERATLDRVCAAHDPTRQITPTIVLSKVDLFRRMTDAECAMMTRSLAAQSERIQAIFNAAQSFRSDAPEWPLLQAMASQLFGVERAAQLMTPGS